MQSQYEKELLKTLKSIDGTLKKIEKSINNDEKHHLNICNAVSHALKGERYTPIQSDDCDVAESLFELDTESEGQDE